MMRHVPDVEATVGLSRCIEPDVLTNIGPFTRLECPTTSTDRHAVNSIAVRQRSKRARLSRLLLTRSVQVDLSNVSGWSARLLCFMLPRIAYLAQATGPEHEPSREAILCKGTPRARVLAAILR